MARFFLAMLAATAAGTAAGAAPAESFKEAQDALIQMRVADAEKGFAAVLDDSASTAADRSAAGLGLARIQWLVDRNAPAALADLDKARGSGESLCRLDLYDARVLREAERPKEAAALAKARAPECRGAIQTAQIQAEVVKADLAIAAASSGDERRQALAEARALLDGLPALIKLAPDAARQRLEVALMTSDASSALEAWRSYFWLTDHNAPQSFKADDAVVAAVFSRALGPAPALADEIALERLLVRGGFLTETRRFDALRDVAGRAAKDPAYKPVAVYFALRKRFDDATLAFNRSYARGHGDQAAYEAEAEHILSDAAKSLRDGDAKTVLGDDLGLLWMSGRTGGVASVHIGHKVEDTRYHVQQYGRQGEVRFISIDNLASNGYQSWLWDGLGQTGGWSNDSGTIVQVRSAYTSGPLGDLASFDPVLTAKYDADLKRFEQQDADALKTKRVIFLPALQARLNHEARDQVAAKAKADAVRTGQPYERTFLKLDWDAAVGHSIYIHEGRHALDHAEFQGPRALPGEELEFRAKLSEIELGEFPRMPLATILSGDIGDDTAHGKADARIMEGLAAWIEAHPSAVAAYDASVPAAEQIDKLSDEQLRAIAKSLDPYFKEHPQTAQR